MDLSLVLAAGLIALVGLPHGALDPVVAHRYGLIRNIPGGIRFVLAYLLLAAMVVAVWIRFPLPALGAFLLISALHFGRDWQRKIGFGGLGYGATVVGLPGLTHPAEVTQIFSLLLFDSAPAAALLLLQGLGITGLLLLCLDRGRLRRAMLVELLLLGVGALLLAPLWYFVLYFCAFHSPRHLLDEFRRLSERQRLYAGLTMLITTLAALTIAAVSGVHLSRFYESVNVMLYQLVFIGLAALTVPHMCLLEWADRWAPRPPAGKNGSADPARQAFRSPGSVRGSPPDNNHETE